jgi:hypothetical protein
MILKILPIILIAWTTIVQGQSDTLTDAQLKYVYKIISETDQSNINDNEIRFLIIQINFNQIITIIRNQGYPKYKIEPKKKKDQTIIKRATRMTFIHILQSAPEMLLDPNIIELLKKEIDSGNMPEEVLLWTLKSWKKVMPEDNFTQKLPDKVLILYDRAINTLEN